jgi:hypothetical protein
MIGPVQITFRNMAPSPTLEDEVRARVGWLGSLFPTLAGCRVVLEAAQRSFGLGPQLRVRIDLATPETHVVVTHEPVIDTARTPADADTASPDRELDPASVRAGGHPRRLRCRPGRATA